MNKPPIDLSSVDHWSAAKAKLSQWSVCDGPALMPRHRGMFPTSGR